MPRKRRRARRFSPAPYMLAALALAAIVAWAIVPHGAVRHTRTRLHERARVAVATAAPSTQEIATAPPSPNVTQTPLPSPTASERGLHRATGTPSGRLAIVIDDCGQWLPVERELIDLPIPLTLSVMPHVRYTQTVAKLAADAGKGVMLHLPMEPLSRQDAGDGEIRTTMSDDEIAAQTRDDIAQVPLAQGVNNHEGSAASADPRVMRDIMEVVKERGLFFIDSRTNKATVAASVATDDGVPNASRNVFLDDEADVAYTEHMLQHAAHLALERGSAIAIGHPKATTLQAIRDLYPQLQARGVTFVLASSLVH